MANYITHSLNYTSEDARRMFIKGFFEDENALIGVRKIPNVKTGTKLDIFTAVEKITKAYAQGTSFTTATGATLTQRTLTTAQMKAEIAQNGRAFRNSVKQELLNSGVDMDNLEGTELYQVVVDLFKNGIQADYTRQAWMGDTVKETFSSEVPTGTLDEDYKEYDGLMALLFKDWYLGNLTSGQRVQLNDGATTYYATEPVVASTVVTLTGTSGTCNITINGSDYEAEFDTDLTTTAANWVSVNSAILQARFGNFSVSSSGADITIACEWPGMKMTVTSTNLTGDLDGSEADTAAVQASAFKANASYTLFKAMIGAQDSVMRALAPSDKVLHIDQDIADDWVAYMESQGVDRAYEKLISGKEEMYFRGIQIVAHPEWNRHQETDYPNMMKNVAFLVAKDNLVFGVDGENDDTTMEMWYEKKDQNNHVRVEYQAGTQYVDSRLVVGAYAYTT